MDSLIPTKLILFVFIIMISLFILYRIWSKQAKPIYSTIVEPVVEGFGEAQDPKTETEVLRAKYDKTPLSIKGGIPEKYVDLPIREFIVKSSYNSAISGLYASTDALKLTLERGCRFIDFEIFSRNDVEYVSYSGDPEYKTMGTENVSKNRLKLTDALNTAAGSAFSSPTPSTNDPLFILLRIKDNTSPIYKRIAKHINTAFSERLFKGTFNSGTPIGELQGRVVILLDTLSAPKWNEYDKCDSKPNQCLDKVVHLEAGTTNFPLYAYADLLTLPKVIVNRNTKNLKTNINSFMIVEPPQFDAIKPPKPADALNDWHPQFLVYKFYNPGTNELTEYEALFNKYECAFVPMSVYIADANLINSNNLEAKDTDSN
uniref:Phosphatidylinositol-specific phospholipase C X domain-containing protein n=1 Tax=viral metagenome TaxID=1070528 RepID=A0A6C0B6E3_9ZZZZ